MIKLLVTLLTFILFILSGFGGSSTTGQTKTLEELVHMGAVHQIRNSCLTDTARSLHSKNQVKPISLHSASYVLPGTTYWINDFLAVGHMMYDIQLLELLQSNIIDRIVLQRAPCATKGISYILANLLIQCRNPLLFF